MITIRTEVIWQKAESLLVCIRQVAAWNSTGWLQFYPKSHLPLGVRDHQLTQCVIGPRKRTCRMASKSVERFSLSKVHECDRQTDRQTDHATDKCVAIGGIACAARANLPNQLSVRFTEPLNVNNCRIGLNLTSGCGSEALKKSDGGCALRGRV